jgi:hypothetical protein
MPVNQKCANDYRKSTKKFDPKNEDKAYAKYLACYERDFRLTKGFKDLKGLVNSIIELLP